MSRLQLYKSTLVLVLSPFLCLRYRDWDRTVLVVTFSPCDIPVSVLLAELPESRWPYLCNLPIHLSNASLIRAFHEGIVPSFAPIIDPDNERSTDFVAVVSTLLLQARCRSCETSKRRTSCNSSLSNKTIRIRD